MWKAEDIMPTKTNGAKIPSMLWTRVVSSWWSILICVQFISIWVVRTPKEMKSLKS